MILLNIKELCKQRGIKHPHAALTRAGITNTVTTDYLKPKKDRFVTEDIELLLQSSALHPERPLQMGTR